LFQNKKEGNFVERPNVEEVYRGLREESAGYGRGRLRKYFVAKSRLGDVQFQCEGVLILGILLASHIDFNDSVFKCL
jgi:hypothetical protein